MLRNGLPDHVGSVLPFAERGNYKIPAQQTDIMTPGVGKILGGVIFLTLLKLKQLVFPIKFTLSSLAIGRLVKGLITTGDLRA